MTTKRYVFEREIHIQARGTPVILKQTAMYSKLHLYLVLGIFENTDFVFFAYLI